MYPITCNKYKDEVLYIELQLISLRNVHNTTILHHLVLVLIVNFYFWLLPDYSDWRQMVGKVQAHGIITASPTATTALIVYHDRSPCDY